MFENLFGGGMFGLQQSLGMMPQTNVFDGIRNPLNMGNLPGGGLSPGGYPLGSQQGYNQQIAAGNPNMSAMDVISQSPEQIMDAASSSGGLLEKLKGLGGMMGGAAGGGSGVQYTPTPISPPNYGGSGPNPGMFQSAGSMMGRGPSGAAMGPAAGNPLMQALMRRLTGAA